MKHFFIILVFLAAGCSRNPGDSKTVKLRTSQIHLADGASSENPVLSVESDGSFKLLNGDPRSVTKLHQFTLLAANGEISEARVQPLPLVVENKKQPVQIDVELSDGSRCKGASDSEQVGYKLSCKK